MRATRLPLADNHATPRGSSSLTAPVPNVRFSPALVARQNIEHYRAMLKSTTDPERRRLIEEMLLDEEAKLRKYNEDHKKQNPALGYRDSSGPGSQE
jgi:hypothetical protein